MKKEDIYKRLREIEHIYSQSLFPKRYISDQEYIQLQKELELIEKHEKNIQLQKEQISKDIDLEHKNLDFFNSLPSKAKKILKDEDYNISLDTDNILTFYLSDDTELARKVMEIRLEDSKSKL